MPAVIVHVAQQLNDNALVQITKDEYFIFRTPEGEIYDKSVMSGWVYISV